MLGFRFVCFVSFVRDGGGWKTVIRRERVRESKGRVVLREEEEEEEEGDNDDDE